MSAYVEVVLSIHDAPSHERIAMRGERKYRVVIVRDGVLMIPGKDKDSFVILGSRMADTIAQRNGFSYAENFVKAFLGQTLQLDGKLVITSRDCTCSHVNGVHAGGSGNCIVLGCACLEYKEAMP